MTVVRDLHVGVMGVAGDTVEAERTDRSVAEVGEVPLLAAAAELGLEMV